MTSADDHAIKLRIERIEARLAKIPADLASATIRGEGLAGLVADLRWLVAELKRARVDLRIARDFGPKDPGSEFADLVREMMTSKSKP